MQDIRRMSATTNCQCACPDPTIVEIPGSPGEPGECTPCADGVNAFTLTTSTVILPAAAGPVVLATSFVNSSWMAIGQHIFISKDLTHLGTFEVLTLPSGTSATLQWLQFPNDSAGTTVIPSGATATPAGALPSFSPPANLTDSTGGAAGATLAAGVGISTLALYVNLVDLAAADLLTTFTLGYKFKILSVAFGVEKAVTTGGKAVTLTPKINGVAVTGGVLSLTSAGLTPQGTVLAASAVTAANTGSSAATISLTGSAVTAFIEGAGWVLLRIQNMDVADAFASLNASINSINATL